MTSLMTVIETQAALQSGKMNVSRAIAGLVGRKQQWEHINSIVAFDDATLRKTAGARDKVARGSRGRLHGIAFAAKDNIDTIDLPTSACTPALRGNHPPRNAPVVQRLLDDGALLLGKANMHELAFGITNNHGAFGAARNPYDPRLIPGGSSGGSAAAVAAGIVPFALGTDTGGSVRIPAALCGVAGLRPTLGRYPQAGVVPISTTRDTVGPIGRTVADLSLLDAVLSGESSSLEPVALRGLRLGVPRHYFYDNLEPGVAEVLERLLDSLRSAGAALIEHDIAGIGTLNEAVSFPVVTYEARRSLERYLEQSAPGVSFESVVAQIASPDVQPVYQTLANVDLLSPQAYSDVINNARPALQQAFASYFRDHRLDACLVPTCCLTARQVGQDQTVELNGAQVPTFATYIRNTDPSSNAGIPSLSIPAGLTAAGLPVGALLEAPHGSDRRLLSIAQAVERVCDPIEPPSTTATRQ
jgi:mandelamide amidase